MPLKRAILPRKRRDARFLVSPWPQASEPYAENRSFMLGMVFDKG
jgi:hypothetical protein